MDLCKHCLCDTEHDCASVYPIHLKLCLNCALKKGVEKCTDWKCSSRLISSTICEVLYKDVPNYFEPLYEDLFTIPNLKEATWIEALQFLKLGIKILCLHPHQRLMILSLAFSIKNEEQARELLLCWNFLVGRFKHNPYLHASLFLLLKVFNKITTFHHCMKFFKDATDSEGNNLLHYVVSDRKLTQRERMHFCKILLANSQRKSGSQRKSA